MTELQKPSTNVPANVRWQWPTVHPEGYKYAGIAAAVAAIFLWFGWGLLGWPMIGVTLWTLAFFRDPVRVTPTDEKAIVAPADGLVTLIRDVAAPREFQGAPGFGDRLVTRVSIFMSVFDVHINRAPVGGTIRDVVYVSGKFVNADLDKASEENERQYVLIEMRDGTLIGMTQIAGLVARRIVPWIKPGDMVVGGQRIGMIRFGSRVDVFLPEGTAPQIALGQSAIAGETILATIGKDERSFGVSQ